VPASAAGKAPRALSVLSVGAVASFVASPRLSFYIENLSDLLTTLLFILS
jgi:hypothetical protein